MSSPYECDTNNNNNNTRNNNHNLVPDHVPAQMKRGRRDNGSLGQSQCICLFVMFVGDFKQQSSSHEWLAF
jgi:hypothetical protein